jgi:hypothetical protein
LNPGQIYKKGDCTECSNNWPITLLNTAYKIFAILLNNQLSERVQEKLSDVQMGFRPDRSTVNNIFIIRQIFKKFHEYNIDLHNIFIDYTQAYDSIDRNKVFESLNVPAKLISLIALTPTDTKPIVKVNNEYSSKFEVHKGVKQGDPLSATLFSIAIDVIIRKLDTRGNISIRLKQCSAYANNILITARTKQAMIDTFNKLKMESIKYELVINEKKTKYMKGTRRKQSKNEDFQIGNLKIGQVRSFNI